MNGKKEEARNTGWTFVFFEEETCREPYKTTLEGGKTTQREWKQQKLSK